MRADRERWLLLVNSILTERRDVTSLTDGRLLAVVGLALATIASAAHELCDPPFPAAPFSTDDLEGGE